VVLSVFFLVEGGGLGGERGVVRRCLVCEVGCCRLLAQCLCVLSRVVHLCVWVGRWRGRVFGLLRVARWRCAMSTRLRLRRGGDGGGSGRGDGSCEDRLGPIPFPGVKAAGRDAGSGAGGRSGSERRHEAMVRDMERALDRVQSKVDALQDLVDEPLRFPGVGVGGRDDDWGGDGPRPAA